MTEPKKPTNPHVIAYGVTALILLIGAAVVFAVYEIVTAWAVEDYDRVMFGVMLFVAVPLIIAYEFSCSWLSKRTALPKDRLELLGNIFFFGTLFAAAGLAEAEGKPVGILRFFADVLMAAALVAILMLVWRWCAARLTNWWTRGKDQKTSR